MKLLMQKKGFKFLDDWVEAAMFAILIIGLILSLVIDAAIVTYIVIFLCGGFVGRVYYHRRRKLGAPFYIISGGFLIGYVIGSLINDRGYIVVIILFFFLGAYLGHDLHKDRILR